MRLRQLSLDDKDYINHFLRMRRHDLAVYAFENIYIWKALFDIRWGEADGNLCIFFEDATGCFLYLPPLGKTVSIEALRLAFAAMKTRNGDNGVSRVENVEEVDVPFFTGHGYSVYQKSRDYLCLQNDMRELRGNRFKSKRASYNYFVQNYSFVCRPYTPEDAAECLKLYDRWMIERSARSNDHLYRGMLGDSRMAFAELLGAFDRLDGAGSVVTVENELKGCTFGFPLNEDTWCVLYEVTDLSIKGCAQFIFRQFCSRMSQYRFINIMDDSGLANLEKVKMSYHPVRRVPAYNARQQGVPVRQNAG